MASPCPYPPESLFTWPPSFSQVEYLLKKLLGSMSLEMGLGELEELLAQDAQSAQTSGGLSVWQFLELFNSGRCLRGVGQDSLSMAIQEVYQELIQDVLKQVRQAKSPGEDPGGGQGDGDLGGLSLTRLWPQGYLWKRGHLRRNWAERWFQLQPSCLCYFGSEECKEKRGTIPLDAQCCVEVRTWSADRGSGEKGNTAMMSPLRVG